MNTNQRKVEVFSAGCPACEPVVQLVKSIACPSCDVQVLDMKEPEVAEKAKAYGVKTVPSVVIDGKLAGCCKGAAPDAATLRAAGLGVPR
jgi:glutaredoxin